MVVWTRRILPLVILAAVAACAQTNVTQQTPMVDLGLARPDRIWVYDFAATPADLPSERVKLWMGHRPSTPDGLPVLGLASGCSDIIHAFGHGHVGLTAAAATGKIAADLVAGRPPPFDLSAYSATRFLGRKRDLAETPG